MSRKSNLKRILEELLIGKKLTSIDRGISNTNQYFHTLKKMGIELVEEWKPNKHNEGRHKERSLKNDNENIDRAKNYLLKLQRKV